MENGKRDYRYDDAFKQAAIAMVIEQKLPVARAALQVGVSVDTLHKWVVETEHAKRLAGLAKAPPPTTPSFKAVQTRFIVYPNPSGGHMTVRYEGNRTENIIVRILDMVGVELVRLNWSNAAFGDELGIANPTLRNGVYFVEFNDGTTISSTLILVIR